MQFPFFRGFSLIELMVTLSVTLILATLATPSFSSLINRNRSQTQLDETLATLRLARMTAITEQTLVTVCPGKSPQAGCTQHWQDGILVYRGHYSEAPDAERLVYTQPSHRQVQLNGNVARFLFNDTGTLSGQAGSLRLCLEQGHSSLAHRVVINRGGRIRSESLTLGDDCVTDWKY